MQCPDLTQHAINPVADPHEALLGFEVNIAGLPLYRIHQDRIDHPDNRSGEFAFGTLDAGKVDLAGLHLIEDAVNRQHMAVVGFDRVDDFAACGHPHIDPVFSVECGIELVEHHHIVRIG